MSEAGDRAAVTRAHERIDVLQNNVSSLVPVVQRGVETADRALNLTIEASAVIREHVAECRLLREADERKFKALTDAQKESRTDAGRRWDWLINAMMVAGAVMLWDLVKHQLLHMG